MSRTTQQLFSFLGGSGLGSGVDQPSDKGAAAFQMAEQDMLRSLADDEKQLEVLHKSRKKLLA